MDVVKIAFDRSAGEFRSDLEAAARQLGWSPRITEGDFGELCADWSANPSEQVLVANLDSLTHETARLIASIDEPRAVVFLTEEVTPEQIKLVRLANLGCVVVRNASTRDDELSFALETVATGRLMGLERHLGPDVQILSTEVSDARADKEQAIEVISAFAAQSARNGDDISEVISFALDEMLTNAIYRAPRVDDGIYKYAKGSEIVLQSDERVRLTYASDGEFFGVSVRDAQGTLTRATVLEYLHRVMCDDREVDEEGGLGLFLIWTFVDRFVVNIRRGVSTEVIGLINLGIARDQAEDTNKSVHIFEY